MISNIKYTDDEINNIILLNVLKMLNRRNILVEVDKYYEKLKNTLLNNIFKIVLSDKIEYNIYILEGKISNISQNTNIYNYLIKNIDIKKIVIGNFDSIKPIKQIVNNFKNVEFFFKEEMMEDIPSKIYVPEHILLSKQEKIELLSYYNKEDLPKMLIHDVMSRYYKASVGDIFKIIRPSMSNCYTIYYRRVISNGNNNCLNL